MTEAYIYDALRTPRGKGRPDGALHEVTSVALSAKVLNAVKERNHLDGAAVEDVIWGNATQVGEQGGCSRARRCCSRISTSRSPASRSTASVQAGWRR